MKTTIKFWIFCVPLIILTACGGGDDLSSSNPTPVTDVDPDTELDPVVPDTDTDTGSNISYLPLMTYESYDEWYGGIAPVYRSYSRDPYIKYFTINPVNATTLEPINTATADDFIISEDGLPVNPRVSFPLLQAIVGNQVKLRTAIVINTSSSMYDTEANDANFIQGIKDYVAAAQANSNYYMAEQEFTVWGYSGVAIEETNGATTDNAQINTALDTVLSNWQSGAYESYGGNNTYDAIVEAVGRYDGPGEFTLNPTLEYKDSTTAAVDDNDLVDRVTPDFIKASTVILFSTGAGTPNIFGPEFAGKALESQATQTYQSTSTPNGSNTDSELLGKPLIYVVPGDLASADDEIIDLAYSTINVLPSSGTYSFSSAIVSAQIASLDAKNISTNQHSIRWASAIRSGVGHKILFETKTASNKFGFKLNSDLDFATTDTSPLPTPQVEITGANNEYIATNSVVLTNVPAYDAATTYADLISKFYPATRWTNQEFNPVTDYVWTYSPVGAINISTTDGSATIAAGATYPITLTLTNSAIDHQGGIITDDFVLTILESN